MLYEVITNLGSEFIRMKRFGTIFTVIMMDIDYFKMVNDTYGHEGGDIVLVEIAQLLKNSVRKSDLVARFGGEEFLIILTGTGEKSARIVAEKMRSKIEQTEFNVRITSYNVCYTKLLRKVGSMDFRAGDYSIPRHGGSRNNFV